MPVVRVDPSRKIEFEAAISDAAREIIAGHLVAFAAETVYGLGADATSGEALARIFERKGRPKINPLIVHFPDLAASSRHVTFNRQAEMLATAFWPGGLTLVLPKRPGSDIHDLASAGLPSLAIRVPSHPVAHALLLASEVPVAAPSANRSGEPSPTCASHVADSIGSDDITILDAGPSAQGLESTIIGFDGDKPILLRHGAISRSEIEAVVGPLPLVAAEHNMPLSPGRLLRHYAPKARIRLNADYPESGELFLGFGRFPQGVDGLQLSAAGSTREAAANLFALLREADHRGALRLAVAPIPNEGLGEAINDRLTRAAAAQE